MRYYLLAIKYDLCVMSQIVSVFKAGVLNTTSFDCDYRLVINQYMILRLLARYHRHFAYVRRLT